MHDPEFEKHVQKKLEELEFNPSENVWKKVEEEIKKDKKRRIPLLWIFLLGGLLLGGTYWIFSARKNTNTISQNKIDEVKSKNEKIKSGETKAADSQIENGSKNEKEKSRKTKAADCK